ncbi:MAG: hypothetical protein AAF541_05255 [Pseudomonadota bacterium]
MKIKTFLGAFVLLFISPFALADDDYVTAWGPGIGAKAPIIDALDQSGAQQTTQSLMGSKGLLVVFNRSVDW